MVPEPRKTELVNACYPIIGAVFEVYKTLGPGLPEYIYQEALLHRRGPHRKPNAVFAMGRAGSSEYSLPKRNFGTCIEDRSREETSIGNVIIECKALTQLTEKEHYQTFGYLRGTGYPAALLVNFGTSPKVQLERFHNNNGQIEVF